MSTSLILEEASRCLTSLRNTALSKSPLTFSLSKLRLHLHSRHTTPSHVQPLDVISPFLSIIKDPLASALPTLTSLSSLLSLLNTNTLGTPSSLPSHYDPTNPSNCRFCLPALLDGVLGCKFEQTDRDDDEVVEKLLASLIVLIVTKCVSTQAPSHSKLLTTAQFLAGFQSIYITNNSFVHSKLLCCNAESSLFAIGSVVFSTLLQEATYHDVAAGMFDFVIQQVRLRC